MGIRNCTECGRVFVYVINDMCPNCVMQEDAYFKTIADYVKDNPKVDVAEISKGTGIDAGKIIKMLKGGRLIPICEQHDLSLLVCERCGISIANGRFCPRCFENVSKMLIGVAREYREAIRKKVEGIKPETKSNFTRHFLK